MYRVLVADDESIERVALTKKLETYFGDSCQITEAGNGAEAVRLFREQEIQIAIMDIAMPGMNGVEAAEEIRRQDADCVIIFLTAYDEFSYAKRAIVIRALDYLLKPCDENELVSVMEEAMRQTDRRTGGNRPEGERGPGCGRPDRPSVEDGSTDQVAGAMRQYIRDNYMREISMQDAARALNYSDVYFCKLFKQYFGQNFTAYLTQFRIHEARKLLMNPAMNVKEAGMRVGYADSNYFAKVFKRLTGMIPSEFRDGQNAQN